MSDEPYDEVVFESKDPINEMDYMRAFKFVFDHPNWFMNLCMIGICLFIPVVGPIVALGYLYILIERFHHMKSDQSYPKFEFSKFSDYLSRGIWVFLVGFVVAIVMVPIMLIVQGLIAVIASMDDEGLITLVASIGSMGVSFVLSFCLQLVIIPVSLRAGFSQDFKTSFDSVWIKHFIATMWKEIVISILFMIVGFMILEFIGIIMCCVGLIPAMGVGMLAQHHMYWQLYEVYLSRGGEPIPLKTME